MYDQVMEASPHLSETAEILKIKEDQVFVLGYAFKSETVDKNLNRNILKDIELNIISSDFSKKTSNLSQKLFRSVE